MKGGSCSGGTFESNATGAQRAAEQSMYNTAAQIECTYNSATGKTGGTGVVIIRYAGSQKGSGGTVTSSGGYTYHQFNSSGTYTP